MNFIRLQAYKETELSKCHHFEKFEGEFMSTILKIFIDIRPLLRYIIYCPLRK